MSSSAEVPIVNVLGLSTLIITLSCHAMQVQRSRSFDSPVVFLAMHCATFLTIHWAFRPYCCRRSTAQERRIHGLYGWNKSPAISSRAVHEDQGAAYRTSRRPLHGKPWSIEESVIPNGHACGSDKEMWCTHPAWSPERPWRTGCAWTRLSPCDVMDLFIGGSSALFSPARRRTVSSRVFYSSTALHSPFVDVCFRLLSSIVNTMKAEEATGWTRHQFTGY